MAKDKVKGKKSVLDLAEAGRWVLLLLQAKHKEAEELEEFKLTEHRLGLWLLQANPWRKLKTSIIYEELIPLAEEKSIKKKAAEKLQPAQAEEAAKAMEKLDQPEILPAFTKALGKRITREQVDLYKENSMARKAEAEACRRDWEAKGGEACSDKQLNSARKKADKAYEAAKKSYKEATAAYKRRIKKLTSKAYARFRGIRFDKALKKVLEEMHRAYLEGELLEKSEEQVGQLFLDSFIKALNAQSGQNKDVTSEWEGNEDRKKLIRTCINNLIKEKYKAFLVEQLTDNQLMKKDKVQAYLEKRFAELATRPGPEKLEAYLEELRQLIEVPRPEKELISEKIDEILQEKYKTFLGKKSSIDLTDWTKVETFVRKTVEGLPPAPDKETIRQEIAAVLKQLENVRVKNNMAEEYGEGMEEESADVTAEKFIRLAQEFYSWILNPEALKANCVLTDKIQKDYLGKRLTSKTIGYTRDYLTFELATKMCSEPFFHQVKADLLPEGYNSYKLEDRRLINTELFDFLQEQETVPNPGKERNQLYHKFNLEYRQIKTAPRQLGEKLGSVRNLLEGFQHMKAERRKRRKNKDNKEK